MSSIIRKEKLFLISTLGLFIVLVSYRIKECDLWIDESFSVYLAQRPLSQIWDRTSPHIGSFFYLNTFPPLYETLLHFLWSPSPKAILIARYLSVSFTLIALYFLFLLGKLLFNSRVGLIAVFLAVLNYSYIFYGKMIRIYPLLNVLSIVSLYLFFKILLAPSFRKRYVISLIILNISILYTFYFGIFVIFLEMIIALGFLRGSKLIKMELCLLSTIFSLLPWLYHLLDDFSREEHIMRFTLEDLGQFFYTIASRLNYGIFYDGILSAIYIGITFFLLFWGIKKGELGRKIIALIIFALLPIIFINFITRGIKDYARARYLFTFVFPFFILGGVFIEKISRYGLKVFIILIIFSLSNIYNYFTGPSWEFWHKDFAKRVKSLKKIHVKSTKKVIVVIEDILFLPLFLYYYYSPKLFWETRKANNLRQLNEILTKAKWNHKIYIGFLWKDEYNLLYSIEEIPTSDWLLVFYSDWHSDYWGKPFEYFYEDRLREEELLTILDPVYIYKRGPAKAIIYRVGSQL